MLYLCLCEELVVVKARLELSAAEAFAALGELGSAMALCLCLCGGLVVVRDW